MNASRSPAVHPLNSSWLACASLSRGVLAVGLKSGAALVYAKVPPRILGSMMRSKSPGRFFVSKIRGRFELAASIPVPEQTGPDNLEALLRASLSQAGRGVAS